MTTNGQVHTNEHGTSRLVLLTPASVWNAVAPVSRLPPEILAYIFLHRAREYYYDHWENIGVPEWVSMSYVCSRWRHVALNCPTLWSYAFVASPRWTDALLIRSKEVPLRLGVYFSPLHRKTALEFMKQVIPHAERFQECYLELQSDDAKVVLPMMSSGPAPLLRTLAITLRHFPYYLNEMDADTDVELDVHDTTQAVSPHTLFSGDTPALRELHLRDYVASWCSPTLGGLTVLRLRNLHYSVRPTIAELKEILGRMPDLECLYLENAIRGGLHDPDSLEATKIHLPRLTQLLIAAPFSRLVRFLSCIDIPATTQVRLGCHLETLSNAEDYASFCALLSGRFHYSENGAASVAHIRTMVFIDNSPRRMLVVFSAAVRTCGRQRCNTLFHEDCECYTPLKVEIDWQRHTEQWKDLVVDICRSVPLARLRNLFLERCRLPSTLWFNVFWYLGRLRYIELIGGEFMDILIPLSLSARPLPKNADTPMDQRTSQLFAPSLETLYLNGVKVHHRLRCGGNPSMHGSHVTLFCEALARRRAAGHGLRLLLINGSSSFSQKEINCLEGVVSDVGVHNSVRLLPDDEHCKDCERTASEEKV